MSTVTFKRRVFCISEAGSSLGESFFYDESIGSKLSGFFFLEVEINKSANEEPLFLGTPFCRGGFEAAIHCADFSVGVSYAARFVTACLKLSSLAGFFVTLSCL